MITLLVLRGEGLLIFRPAVARIHQTVTDLRQVSSDLRISEERYRTLVESSHDLIFCLDSAGQFLYMNQTFMTTLGISAEAMPTLKLSEIVTPGFRTFCNVMLRRTMRGKAYMGLQLNFRTANDDEIMVEGDILPTSNGEDVMMAQCVFRNITLRRQAEMALRDSNSRLVHLSRRLIHIQEEARRHLSRELHDEIGQRMTVVKMQLQALKYKADLADSAKGIDETIEIVEHTLQQIRSISLDLHPSLLDDMGLVATLRWYLDKQAQWGNFETHFSTNLTERLPAEVELVCFRVVQEAVTNVMRHAYANHVHVNLNETPQRVLLTIQDDGIGFDVENALEHSAMGASLGLRGMEERVSLANGRLEIESTFGEGTTVRLTVYPANTPIQLSAERMARV